MNFNKLHRLHDSESLFNIHFLGLKFNFQIIAQYLEDWRLGARRQLPAAILAAILSVSVRLIGKPVNRIFFRLTG